MSEKTLTRMDLSEAVFREVGLSRNESAQLVEGVLQHMSDALVEWRAGQDLVLRHILDPRQSRPGRSQSKDRRRSPDPSAPCSDLPSVPSDERSCRGRQQGLISCVGKIPRRVSHHLGSGRVAGRADARPALLGKPVSARSSR